MTAEDDALLRGLEAVHRVSHAALAAYLAQSEPLPRIEIMPTLLGIAATVAPPPGAKPTSGWYPDRDAPPFTMFRFLVLRLYSPTARRMVAAADFVNLDDDFVGLGAVQQLKITGDFERIKGVNVVGLTVIHSLDEFLTGQRAAGCGRWFGDALIAAAEELDNYGTVLS